MSRMKRQNQEVVKVEDIKTIIQPLPIVLAETPFDQNSNDYTFFNACNMIHKH